MEVPSSAKSAAAEKSEEQAPRFLPLETISVRLLAPPHTDGRLVFGVVSNISQTGACVITNRSLPVVVAVALEIAGPRPNAILSVSARVVWCAERIEPIKEIVGYLTGVRFQPESLEPIGSLLRSGFFQPIP